MSVSCLSFGRLEGTLTFNLQSSADILRNPNWFSKLVLTPGRSVCSMASRIP